MNRTLAIIFAIVLLFSSQVYAVDLWDKSDPAGTESPADLDSLIPANNSAQDRLHSNYREGCLVSRASASTLTVEAGEVVCSNSAGTIRRYCANTSSTTVTWANIDTGSEATGTTYYLYAVADSDSVTTFTCAISTSSTAPSGVTYYKRLASFYNNAAGDITLIDNDNEQINAYIKTGTYTGTGVAGNTVAHGLGSVPTMIILTRTDNTTVSAVLWVTGEYGCRAFTDGSYQGANTITAVDSTNFTLGTSTAANASGGNYYYIAIRGQ